MPKKSAKAQKSNEPDGAEFFAAISLIEEERDIPKAYMLEKIIQTPASTYKWDREDAGDNVTMKADKEAGTVRIFVKKGVVGEVDNPRTEMGLQMVREKLPHTQPGGIIHIEVRIHNLGCTIAQIARQVIIQGMRETERGMIYDEFPPREHEILTGAVACVDPHSGAVNLRIDPGSEVTEAFLASGEQAKDEACLEGMRLRVYIAEVRHSTKGPQVLISRTHLGLAKRLFELEVSEIYDDIVEAKSIARKTGNRTKLAVWSADPDVDPIGACVDPRGQRISSIVGELKDERADTIKWSEESAEYITAALSPADIVSVAVWGEGKACRAVVLDDQLSLAIGKEGQNARLTTKLTGWKIDIKSTFVSADEGPEDEADVLLDDEVGTEE